jgi:Lipocalin-like domain
MENALWEYFYFSWYLLKETPPPPRLSDARAIWYGYFKLPPGCAEVLSFNGSVGAYGGRVFQTVLTSTFAGSPFQPAIQWKCPVRWSFKRRIIVNRHTAYLLTGITLLGFALLPGSAISQQKSLKDQLAGTWAVVLDEQTLPNGSKLQPFGANPKGILVLDTNGRSYFFAARSDLPKIASNNRLTLTPEEAKAIAEGTFAQVGTYSVDEAKKTFTVHTEISTFPNGVGTDGNFSIVSITADELKYSLEPLGGGQIVIGLKRVK